MPKASECRHFVSMTTTLPNSLMTNSKSDMTIVVVGVGGGEAYYQYCKIS